MKQENKPDLRRQNGLSQTSLAFQEHGHATAAYPLLESLLSQVTHIPCKIVNSCEVQKGQPECKMQECSAARNLENWYRRNLVTRQQNLKKSDEESSFLSQRK